MKKAIAVLLVSIMALSLTACAAKELPDIGDDISQPEQKEEKKTEDKQQEEKEADGDKGGFSVLYDGTEICIHDEAEAVLSALGEANSYFEEESCAFQGMEKTYTYRDIEVTTFEDTDGRDHVYSVYFTSDAIETNEGICIGSSEDALKSAYEGYDCKEVVGEYIYTSGTTSVSFIIKDGSVAAIEYFANDVV